MKKGDIALITSDDGWKKLVQIAKLDYKSSIVKIKTGGTWFNPIYKYETKEELVKVWWSDIGDASGTIHSKSNGTENWDWDYMISNASVIMNQCRLINYEVVPKQE